MQYLTKLSLLLLFALSFTACDDDDDNFVTGDDLREELAETYAERYLANQAYPAVTTRLADLDQAGAYEFQDMFIDELKDRGEVQSGWKLGFTGDSPRPFGAPSPVFGQLFESQSIAPGSTIDISETFVSAAMGVELAIFIAEDAEFETSDFPLSRETVLNLIGSVAPLTEFPELGFEEGPMGIDYRDLIANNAGAKAYVVGERVAIANLDDDDDDAMDIDNINVRIFKNNELISEAISGDALGSQVEALEFLLRQLALRGEGVKAGQIIATGSLGGDLGLEPGEYRFEYAGLGTNTFTVVE